MKIKLNFLKLGQNHIDIILKSLNGKKEVLVIFILLEMKIIKKLELIIVKIKLLKQEPYFLLKVKNFVN